MIPLISARQEPQLVPALSLSPTASTLWQPSRTAAVIWLTPTLKHEQTVAPGSGVSAPGRPAVTAKRLARLWCEAPSCDTAQLRATATGRGERNREASSRSPSKKARRSSPEVRSV